jgi:hypothetical protein
MPTLSWGYHPTNDSGMCAFSAHYLINSADSKPEKDELMKHFKFKRNLVMRGEHAFYHTLCLMVPELSTSERILDGSLALLAHNLGKRKTLNDQRPDYYHSFISNGQTFSLHGEYDETDGHEDDDDRLGLLAEMGNSVGRTYVFRVQARHYTDAAVCKRRQHKDNTYYTLTEHGKMVAQQAAEIIRQRLAWIAQGLAPSGTERPWKVYIRA